MEYDIIGDIHGHLAPLERLLRQLGYARGGGTWRAPQGRQAVFVGDLIDRGPEQIGVLDTVRRMVDDGSARCVLGNHELNAIGWVTPREGGTGFLREHSEAKGRQHAEFLRQVGEGSDRHLEWVDWFRTLPVALDLGGIRVVHAWWHPALVHRLASAGAPALQGDWLQEAFRNGGEICQAYDLLTKGQEIPLPAGHGYRDKDGHARRELRTQWWRDDGGTYRDIAAVPPDQLEAIPDLPLPPNHESTPIVGAPVFVGHYWLKGPVERRSPKLACLDFSVAAGGPLVAYRWQGETEIDDRHFVAA
jgi:hypothetical protein